jgi:hypothetical protein
VAMRAAPAEDHRKKIIDDILVQIHDTCLFDLRLTRFCGTDAQVPALWMWGSHI